MVVKLPSDTTAARRSQALLPFTLLVAGAVPGIPDTTAEQSAALEAMLAETAAAEARLLADLAADAPQYEAMLAELSAAHDRLLASLDTTAVDALLADLARHPAIQF